MSHPHPRYTYKYRYKYNDLPRMPHPIASPSLSPHHSQERRHLIPEDSIQNMPYKDPHGGLYNLADEMYRQILPGIHKACGHDIGANPNHPKPLARSNQNKNLTITFDHIYRYVPEREKIFYELFRGEGTPTIQLTVDGLPFPMHYSKVPTEKYPTVEKFISFAHDVADACGRRGYDDVFDAIAGLIAEKWLKEPIK
jgi:hypothetical protein